MAWPFTHEQQGAAAVAQLLRGMAGFVIFCALVAGLVERAGILAAFALATVAAPSVQLALARTRVDSRVSGTPGPGTSEP